MPAMVSALDHGIDLVGIKAVAFQCLWNLPSERRFSTNDLNAGFVMRDPKTALENRLQGVRERAVTYIVEQPGHCENPGVVPG